MDKAIFEKMQKAFPGIKKHVLLKNHTTFKIGGPAEYFLLARTKKELLKTIYVAKKFRIKVFVLGGGSNLLVSDEGIRGLVIKFQSKESIQLKPHDIIEAPAGMVLSKVVTFSTERSLEGLEWAGGLPGTFGGAIRGNAGAFGGEMKDSIVKVLALDDALRLRTLSNSQCKFSYRNSIFKQKNWVVVSGLVKLKKGVKKELKEVANSHIAYRKERHPLEYPNAGSIFKNVPFAYFSGRWKKELLPVVKKDPFPVVPTAYLISEAGLKGATIGKAQVSPKHPNYIVNLGGAKAKDVLELITLVKKKIKQKYHIILEVEVQFLEN